MVKKSESIVAAKSIRVELSAKLHKRVKQAALDEDTTVKQLVLCLLDAYTAQPRKERNIVAQGCRDGVLSSDEPETEDFDPTREDAPVVP